MLSNFTVKHVPTAAPLTFPSSIIHPITPELNPENKYNVSRIDCSNKFLSYCFI